jgi:hypothetical protein
MRTSPNDPAHCLAEDGFQIFSDVLSANRIAEFAGEAARFSDDRSAGIRGLLQCSPVIRQLSSSPELMALAMRAIPAPALPVRAILFDKTPGTNWKVPWHQDLTIAVVERREVEGFGPWSVKDGVPHAHAPVWLLERMVTLRLHLDDCPADNGALRVLPGSHRHAPVARFFRFVPACSSPRHSSGICLR